VAVKQKTALSTSDKKSVVPAVDSKPSGAALAVHSGKNKRTEAGSGIKYTWHVVQKGDTLYSIAKRYEGTVDEIKSLNKLNTNELKPGTKLRVKVSG
jgi:LysM repeat protein